MAVEIIQYEDGYTLKVDGREGDTVGYGEIASATDASGVEYIAQVAVDGEEISSVLGEAFAYRAVPANEISMSDAEEEAEVN